MNGQEILARLRKYEPALRARGVSHAALFGSRARGDNRPDSDIDIMIEIDPEAHVGVWGYVGLKEYIAALFDEPVDVVDRGFEILPGPCGDGRRHLCLLIFGIQNAGSETFSITSRWRKALQRARPTKHSRTTCFAYMP